MPPWSRRCKNKRLEKRDFPLLGKEKKKDVGFWVFGARALPPQKKT
jgi:hypothetical protein